MHVQGLVQQLYFLGQLRHPILEQFGLVGTHCLSLLVEHQHLQLQKRSLSMKSLSI
jgi:hypothetical protein